MFFCMHWYLNSDIDWKKKINGNDRNENKKIKINYDNTIYYIFFSTFEAKLIQFNIIYDNNVI